jgi:hypothetical protein
MKLKKAAQATARNRIGGVMQTVDEVERQRDNNQTDQQRQAEKDDLHLDQPRRGHT